MAAEIQFQEVTERKYLIFIGFMGCDFSPPVLLSFKDYYYTSDSLAVFTLETDNPS